MEKVDFVILDTNGNRTALILSRHIERYHSIILKKMLESYQVEQVGFLAKSNKIGVDAKILMMGDEFCGNAIAALGAYIGEEKGLKLNDKASFSLESTGVNTPIKCNVISNNGFYKTKVDLPLPVKINKSKIKFKKNLVNITTINYSFAKTIIIENELFDLTSKNFASRILEEKLDRFYPLNISSLFSIKTNFILPLVYVTETKTKIWEHSCALASASSAVILANSQKKSGKYSIMQPSRTYTDILIEYKQGKISKLSMEANVSIISEGNTCIKA